jgi:hypothetical protein
MSSGADISALYSVTIEWVSCLIDHRGTNPPDEPERRRAQSDERSSIGPRSAFERCNWWMELNLVLFGCKKR